MQVLAHVTAEVDGTRKTLLCGQAKSTRAVSPQGSPFSKADICISVIPCFPSAQLPMMSAQDEVTPEFTSKRAELGAALGRSFEILVVLSLCASMSILCLRD